MSSEIGNNSSVENLSPIEIYISDKERQAARATLREKFLKIITSEIGNKCDLLTVENNIVSGQFEGSDLFLNNLCVKDLRTPIGVIPDAFVRSSDVTVVSFKNPLSVQLKKY